MTFPSKRNPQGRKKAESATGSASRLFLTHSSKASVKAMYAILPATKFGQCFLSFPFSLPYPSPSLPPPPSSLTLSCPSSSP